MSVVAARNLALSFRRADGSQHPVLRDVNLAVEEGELVALLGPNGGGKTTLLRILAGTLRPDAGDLQLFGRPAHAWSRIELARRVAVLPQSLDLPAGFRVAEVVAMGRSPHATRLFGAGPGDERAVEGALLDADAFELAHRSVDELSGGERQRVLIAMALAQEPELLLLDEPTLHLDISHQAGLLATIARIRRRRSLTVVTVLHDLNLAVALAPRVAVLHEGRIAADGTPVQVLSPERVAAVFGSPVDEAWTSDGARFLVPRVTSNEPIGRSTPSTQ